jgi:hypothetical protein
VTPLALAVCPPLVRARLANVVGDATGTSGLWSSEDLGCSIVEGCSTSIVDCRIQNVQHQRPSNVKKGKFNECQMSNVDVQRRNVERRSSNGQGHMERFQDFGEYVCSKKRGVQHRTPKTPTNNAWITSGGCILQTRGQIRAVTVVRKL